MIEISEKVSGGYEVRKLPYGKVCTWYPDHSVLECECGGLLFCAGSAPICRCGADHTALVRDLSGSIPTQGASWRGDLFLPPEEHTALPRAPREV